MASGPINSWQIQWEIVEDYFFHVSCVSLCGCVEKCPWLVPLVVPLAHPCAHAFPPSPWGSSCRSCLVTVATLQAPAATY